MNPSDEVDTGVFTFRQFLSAAGPTALLAFAASVVVFALAVRLARRRGPQRVALALFAASWVAVVPMIAEDAADPTTTWLRLSAHWSDAVSSATAPAIGVAPANPAALLVASAALLLGLVGSVAALTRSTATEPLT